jgi:hypothetical protein
VWFARKSAFILSPVLLDWIGKQCALGNYKFRITGYSFLSRTMSHMYSRNDLSILNDLRGDDPIDRVKLKTFYQGKNTVFCRFLGVEVGKFSSCECSYALVIC